MSLLSLRNVSKSYGATLAVSHADLEVPAGSRTAIVGPSGSGKTTLLRLVAGFETPDEGEITLGDADLTTVPAHLRGIGYVAQEGALFPHLSIAANIGFGIERGAADRNARIEMMMDAVGLPRTMLTRRPHELSGGQQQRVALARALARQPRLMLLDEPFSALDAGLRDATRDMVAKVLGDAGVTAILVTHDQAEALSFADHLAVMRDRLVIQSGPPRQLYEQPRDAETARFLGDAIILPADCADGWANCALGRLPLDRTDAHGAASILLRPEQVVLQPAQAGEGGHAVGRVESLSFRGASCRMQVAPLNGADWPTITLYAASIAAPKAGDHVRLSLLGSAHVLE